MNLTKHVAVIVAVSALAMSVSREAIPCTVITVGKEASTDGSVITSHTVDDHRLNSDVRIVPRKTHPKGAMFQCSRRENDDSGPMQRYRRVPTGKIPQVRVTYGYLASRYPPMNEHQLAIGESTFSGRKSMVSEAGLLDCETTQELMLQRAKTAREAIRIGGALIEKYGWIDGGESLTIVDPEEAWLMEIIGPGKGKVGAIWVARRIPDDHVSVVANASRIGALDLTDEQNTMASANVKEVAVALKFWDPESGRPFAFNEAYNPGGRMKPSSTRREWRIYDRLAPSLKLDPRTNHLPFSIKPDKKVAVEQIMDLFRDTYEGTEFDMTAQLTVTDEKTGKTIKSPLANPFMPYDANKLHRINGGWGWRGERTIARWYTMYSVITQSRSWLPDPIGGVAWFSYDNNAMTTWVPFYMGITDLPRDYKTDARETGFSRKSAWWAFNRVSTIASQRWGDMRKDVKAVRYRLQQQLLAEAKSTDGRALKIYKQDSKSARRFLTETVRRQCAKVVNAYWALGDRLWNKYDELW